MAMSPSPQMSPIMGGAHRIDRRRSNSPPPQDQQLSKRDKRRTMLQTRLADITSQFSDNRDAHYRDQLQALQIDMNLIMEADPNGTDPLPNSPGEIDKLVNEVKEKGLMKGLGQNALQRAGKVYADFAKECNDAMEERDTQLVVHKRDYTVKMSEIEADYLYRKKLASNEFKSLGTSLRDRLINSVINKKNRLSKDKESIEIDSSNALLLHPSQFGLANPASPSGLHGKRATRHRREADEIPNFTEGNKRKRKANDSDESPAPTRQRMENGTSTPVWYAEKNATTSHQVDTALFSVEKLFTEKELAMTYNSAALAAHSFILRHPHPNQANSPSNDKSDASSENEKAIITTAEAEPEDDDSLIGVGGAMMERQFSHATRSTRGAPTGHYVTGFGVDALGDINYPGNIEALVKQVPKLPPMVSWLGSRTFNRNDLSSKAEGPFGLSDTDALAEYEMIKRARSYNEEVGLGSNLDREEGGRALLEAVAEPRTYQHWIPSKSKEKYGKVRESNVREDGGTRAGSPIESVPMSRQATGDSITMSSKGRTIKRRPEGF